MQVYYCAKKDIVPCPNARICSGMHTIAVGLFYTEKQAPNAVSCQPLSVTVAVSRESDSVMENAGNSEVCVTLTDTGDDPFLLEPVTARLTTADITTGLLYDTLHLP